MLSKRFASKSKDGTVCPCCQQDTTGPGLATLVKESLLDILSTSEALRAGRTKEEFRGDKQFVEDTKALFGEVLDLKSRNQPLQEAQVELRLAEGRVQELKHTSEELIEMIAHQQEGLDSVSEKSARCDKAYQALFGIRSRWQTLSSRRHETDEKKRRQSQSMLCSELGNRSLDEVERNHRDMMQRKDALQQKKDRLSGEDAHLTKKFYQIKGVLSERELAVNTATIEGQKHSDLEKQIADLQYRLRELEAKSTVMRRERDTASREVNEKLSVLNRGRRDFGQKEASLADHLSQTRADASKLRQQSDSVQDLSQRFQQSHLEGVEDKLATLQERISSKEDSMRNLAPEIQSIQKLLSSQEHTRRNVLANLDLRSNQAELQEVNEKLQTLTAKAGQDAGQLRTSERELQRANQERSKLTSTRDTFKGKLEIYNQQVVDVESKLKGPMYRNIEERYRRKNIEYETTNMAVSDIENYHNAVDKALQNFHTLKIREINKIIQELWQLIYKGQDIDMIEIESGREEGAALARSARSYNYRVVMRKANVPLDMRGRCSAGQRVLASIVIRLALAETFCLNCGILALDEPTTNLDEPNKQGLAQALARIIINRSRQKNFQLICITHDEDFVRIMSTELALSPDFSLPEYYFRVCRREDQDKYQGKFFSHIERIRWEDM
jgi:DNA repair protein RAD50